MAGHETNMGEGGRYFQTTRWTEIMQIRTLNESRKKQLLGDLITSYWKPVYNYLRARGYGNDRAKDLTQGFFHEAVLARGLAEKAEKNKGKFRTFMLVSLNRYVRDVNRMANAVKRRPQEPVLSILDEKLLQVSNESFAESSSPEEVFNYAWAISVLEQVLKDLEEWCYDTGKESHWSLFNDKVVEPILQGVPVPAISNLCKKYGVDSCEKASNMIAYVKLKFHHALKKVLSAYADSEEGVQEEFNDMFQILSKGNSR